MVGGVAVGWSVHIVRGWDCPFMNPFVTGCRRTVVGSQNPAGVAFKEHCYF